MNSNPFIINSQLHAGEGTMPCWFYEQRAETLKCDVFKNDVIPGNFPQRTFQQVSEVARLG